MCPKRLFYKGYDLKSATKTYLFSDMLKEVMFEIHQLKLCLLSNYLLENKTLKA